MKQFLLLLICSYIFQTNSPLAAQMPPISGSMDLLRKYLPKKEISAPKTLKAPCRRVLIEIPIKRAGDTTLFDTTKVEDFASKMAVNALTKNWYGVDRMGGTFGNNFRFHIAKRNIYFHITITIDESWPKKDNIMVMIGEVSSVCQRLDQIIQDFSQYKPFTHVKTLKKQPEVCECQ